MAQIHEVICPKIPELESRPLFSVALLVPGAALPLPVKAVTAAGAQMSLRLVEGGIPCFGSQRH